MKYLYVIVVLVLNQIVIGQDYESEFLKNCETNDFEAQLKTLKDWEESNPEDPELYTSYFNYHFSKSKTEKIAITADQPYGKSIVVTDSLNNTKGYLGSHLEYEKDELTNAFKKIDEGIKKFPNRLDMRFGKVYVLGVIEDWNLFTTEIITAIEYSSENKNNWIWTNNTARDDAGDFFLSALQDYQLQLYNTGNDALLRNMREIATSILKYYPNHIESLSNLSITYLLNEEYDKAIAPLLKAEKLAPKDFIVLSNIAYAYKLKGEKKKAIKYYKKTVKFGDEKAIDYAKQQLEELKK